MIAATLALLVFLQDDVSKWVEGLSSDRIETRDEAARRLERLGAGALGRIEKAAAAAGDLEVKARLEQIARAIRKRAEFAKVFGETKRATLEAKARPLGDVLADLSRQLDEKIEAAELDAAARVTLTLQGATLWEAMDVLSRAAEVHWEYEDEDKIVVRKGAIAPLPVHYLEQFRVGVVEVKRIEHRSPKLTEASTLLVLEVRHQKNMRPSGDVFMKRFSVDELKDAKGADVLTERPRWGSSMSLMGRPHALQDAFSVRPDAVGPLTVSGTALIPFALTVKELALPLTGENREVTEGAFVLKIKAFGQSPAGTSVTLEARSTDGSEISGRLEEGLVLVDEKGKKHESESRGGGGSTDHYSWDYEFPAGIPKPQKLVFRWIVEFKTVEIPFRFEGVPLP